MRGEWKEPWRFWSKVERAPSGCWEWTGYRTPAGYGHGRNFAYPENGEARTVFAHRQSYVLERGPIPPGKDIDHLCRNRACVNPEHLEPVSRRENLLRSPITLAAQHVAKTHCAKGHPFDAENTRVVGVNGHRYCKPCNRQAQAEWRARNPRKTRT